MAKPSFAVARPGEEGPLEMRHRRQVLRSIRRSIRSPPPTEAGLVAAAWHAIAGSPAREDYVVARAKASSIPRSRHCVTSLSATAGTSSTRKSGRCATRCVAAAPDSIAGRCIRPWLLPGHLADHGRRPRGGERGAPQRGEAGHSALDLPQGARAKRVTMAIAGRSGMAKEAGTFELQNVAVEPGHRITVEARRSWERRRGREHGACDGLRPHAAHRRRQELGHQARSGARRRSGDDGPTCGLER